MCTRQQTLLCYLQTHEAELNLTARTDDVFAACFVVLHLLAAGGTGPYGGTFVDPLHLREGGGFAVLEKLEIMVYAALIVAAVGAGGWTFPWVHTLPAELEWFHLVFCTDCALNIEVVQIPSLHVGFTPRTLLERIMEAELCFLENTPKYGLFNK